MTAVQHEPDQPYLAEITTVEASGRLLELLGLVDDDARTIYLTRDGKRVAAIVPADAAEYLDRVEDEYYARRATEAMEDGGPTIPWEQVKAELHLDDEGHE